MSGPKLKLPKPQMKNGKPCWRGSVMVNLVRVRKWFDDDSKASYKAMLDWEESQRSQMLEVSKNDTEETATVWTIEMWSNYVLDNAKAKMAPATYKEKKSVFKFLKSKKGGLGKDFPVSSIDYNMAEEYLDSQSAERSGNAANKDRKNLAAGWKLAQRKHRQDGFPATGNPWLEAERYQETRHPRYVPPMDHMWAVLDSVDDQDHAMLTTMLHLAARRSEVFRLTWNDIDFTRGKVRLMTRKTDNGEWRADLLPMTKECRKALMRQWEARTLGQEFVFVQAGEYAFDAKYAGQHFRNRQHFMTRICDKIGIKPFGFHAIRHLAAGALFEAGYEVATIQKVLRHKSPNTTVVYLRDHGYDVDHLEEALETALAPKPRKVIPLAK